jgi:uncharacterized protein with PIN domain
MSPAVCNTPKFVADVMVGKLARWLRILGYDVLYNNRFEDDEILQLAEAQDRIVVTRDVELHQRAGARSLLIENDDYEIQVRQVIDACGLKEASLFTRCAECNTMLVETDREAVFLRVPPYVYLTQKHFATCPACDRVYWRGSHTDGIAAKMKKWMQP